jgi:hypothetical protein
MTDTPPNWVLIEAAKRSGFGDDPEALFVIYRYNNMFRALCDMIQKYEQPPVDRKLLCAQAALTGFMVELDARGYPKKQCMWDYCVRAIELFEKGFGRD